jgi:uncharacterized ubiquitin-like protein YukD
MSPGQLTLKIRMLGGDKFDVDLPSHSTVNDLKRIIRDTRNTEIRKAIHRGKILKDDQSLSPYNNEIIVLLEEHYPLHLIIQNMEGKQYQVDTNTDTSVAKLKQDIAQLISFDEFLNESNSSTEPVRERLRELMVRGDQIKLFIPRDGDDGNNPVIFDDTKKLHAYGLQNNDVVQVFIERQSHYGMRPRRKKSAKKAKKSAKKAKKSVKRLRKA